MGSLSDIEGAIIRQLVWRHQCAFDELVCALPGYSWGQIFAAVDRLSRQGRVSLQHPTRFGFEVSVRT